MAVRYDEFDNGKFRNAQSKKKENLAINEKVDDRLSDCYGNHRLVDHFWMDICGPSAAAYDDDDGGEEDGGCCLEM